MGQCAYSSPNDRSVCSGSGRADRGATVRPLPRYSPEFNPIEHLWSKLKHWIKKARADTEQALTKAVESAVLRVSVSDAEGWFAHCGLCPQCN
ncbi:transposase [Rhodocaloribacter sp.]